MKPSLLRALLVAAALAVTVAPAAAQVGKNIDNVQRAEKDATYLTSPELRRRALEALFEKIGRTPLVSKIAISEAEITVWAQSRQAAYYTDEWTVRRTRLLIFDRDTVSGPRGTDGDGIVRKREDSFFDYASIKLDQIEALVADGVAMAQMEQRPNVAAFSVARRIGVLPEPFYGAVQMTLSLSTERETATIYADADARIIGADLSGTMRMQRLDLIAEDDWPMAEAQQRLAEAVGGKQLNELRVYNSYVFVQAQHPTNEKMMREFSWTLGGVTVGMDMEDFTAGLRDTAPFGMNEIDLTKLPQIKRAALAAFDSDGAVITYVDANKPTDRAGQQQVLWSVELRQGDGEEGRVLLDANAEVVEVRLPESRAAALQGPWLAPKTVVATLERLEREFGPDARFGEISLNDTQGTVLVEDPQAPGTMASFIVKPQEVIRFGTPMPWEAELDATRTFRIADLAALDPKLIGALADRTVQRMKLEGAAVFRYTISKRMLMMTPEDDRLLLEIRAGKDDGWIGGWVTYDLAGAEVDVMTP